MLSSKRRAQIALAIAVCFASLATFAVCEPAAQQERACPQPAWSILSWGGSDCR